MWFSFKEWEKPFKILHWIQNSLKKPCIYFSNPERAKSSSLSRYDSIFSCWFFGKNGFFLKKIKKIHFFQKINKKKSNPGNYCSSRFHRCLFRPYLANNSCNKWKGPQLGRTPFLREFKIEEPFTTYEDEKNRVPWKYLEYGGVLQKENVDL